MIVNIQKSLFLMSYKLSKSLICFCIAVTGLPVVMYFSRSSAYRSAPKSSDTSGVTNEPALSKYTLLENISVLLSRARSITYFNAISLSLCANYPRLQSLRSELSGYFLHAPGLSGCLALKPKCRVLHTKIKTKFEFIVAYAIARTMLVTKWFSHSRLKRDALTSRLISRVTAQARFKAHRKNNESLAIPGTADLSLAIWRCHQF